MIAYMQRAGFFICVLLTALMLPLPIEAADAVPLQPAHPTQVNWNLTPEQVRSTCSAQIAAFDAAVKRIMAIHGRRTFRNTLLPLENAEADLNDRLVAQSFLFNMAIDKP